MGSPVRTLFSIASAMASDPSRVSREIPPIVQTIDHQLVILPRDRDRNVTTYEYRSAYDIYESVWLLVRHLDVGDHFVEHESEVHIGLGETVAYLRDTVYKVVSCSPEKIVVSYTGMTPREYTDSLTDASRVFSKRHV